MKPERFAHYRPEKHNVFKAYKLPKSQLTKLLMKHSHSHTKTRVKTKEEKLKGDDIHSGVTDWSTVINVHKAPKRPRIEWGAGKNTYTEVVGGFITTAAGAQTYGDVTSIGTADSWLCAQSGTSNLFGTAGTYKSLISLQANQTNTGGSFYPSVVQPSQDKLLLKSCNVKMKVCNLENISASVWIYVLESLQNQDSGPAATWVKTDFQDTLGLSSYASAPAGTNSGGVVGYMQPQFVGSTPNDVADFKRCWKTLKVHRVNLAAGAQEDMDFFVRMNQLGDAAKIINANQGLTSAPASWIPANVSNSFMRGCVTFMVVASGQLINDTTTLSAVTTGSVKIACSIFKEYSFKPVVASQDKYNLAAGITQLGFGAALVSQKLVNVQDVLANVAQA